MGRVGVDEVEACIDRLARSVREAQTGAQPGYADGLGGVWVRADGLWYRRPGLGSELRGVVAIDGGRVRIAHPWEHARLVSGLPRRRGIVIGTDALVLLEGSGRVVALECAPRLEIFQEVTAGELAGVHLFERALLSAPPGLPRSLRESLETEDEGRVPGATAWHRAALEAARAVSPEAARGRVLGQRIERAVRMGGARLDQWYEVGEDESVVVWRGRGRRVTTHVRSADLSVVSAGICVSGQDRIFDLVALCSAVTRQEGSR